VTLRARLSLVAAGVVAVVVALACATTYFVMRHELQSQLDGSLHGTAVAVQRNLGSIPSDYFGNNKIEVIFGSGGGERSFKGPPLAPDQQIFQVAQGLRSHGFYRTVTVHGSQLREYVAPAADNGAGVVDEAGWGPLRSPWPNRYTHPQTSLSSRSGRPQGSPPKPFPRPYGNGVASIAISPFATFLRNNAMVAATPL